MTPEIQLSLTEQDYHSQTGETTPLFSYSVAKTIIQKSLYHAWLEHPLLGGQSRKPTAAMDKGSIIHGMLLGKGPEIQVIEADSFRTNAAKAERDEAYEAGLIPILRKDMDGLHIAVHEIERKIREISPYFFFSPHDTEVSIRWEMGNGVKTQSRIDWISSQRICDLKTCADASPEAAQRAIIKFGYDIQQAMYLDCANCAFPEMAGRFTWEFIFVEIEPPYMVGVYETDSSMLELGSMKAERASNKWKSALDTGVWPGYGRQMIYAPGWALNKEMEE
jgi:hypothetical protein